MKFLDLQENLRLLLWQKIAAGQASGFRLAREAGFQQAHISNFLNRRRGLSLEAMDRVLASQNLSLLDLLDTAEINKRASIPPPAEESFENVLLVDFETAAHQPVITGEKVLDIYKFKRTFLRRLKPEMAVQRDGWTRFVLVRLGSEGLSMAPRIYPGAVVLIDRHYNSLKPPRRGEPSMYAVRKGSAAAVGYVELAGAHMVLRPHSQKFPVDIIRVDQGKSPADYVVGRICYVGVET